MVFYKSKEEFIKEFKKKIMSLFGKPLEESSMMDKYTAIAALVRDMVNEKWVNTNNHYLKGKKKQVYYFSLEFLLGKFLESNLIYLGGLDICKEGLLDLGISFDEITAAEPDPGLGNGGLGRLAACFLDSLASLSLPGHGCGIRYKYGLFNQKIVDGYQVELPDNWLREANAWEIRKPDKAVIVKFGGNIKFEENPITGLKIVHENYEPVLAVPYDIPIMGYHNNTVNTLRLWSAETANIAFDFKSFSHGDHANAVSYKYSVEAISEVLYPDDSNYENRLLRLKQQYFFVSAGLLSIVRRFRKKMENLSLLPDYVTIQINDTHPSLAIPEFMRILMDEEGFSWEEAWKITTSTIAYTNHTILPEALEKWPVDIFKTLLPRIYMITEEINKRLCETLWDVYPGQWKKIADMAVIADNYVKMANLAIAGSYSVNGVAAVHTEILKREIFKDFNTFFPGKINNKTNGITHRRWLIKSNPGLAKLLNETIGDSWIREPLKLSLFAKYVNDTGVQDTLQKVKFQNKERLAKYINDNLHITVDINSIFDVQVKRIHAYKRQLLNAFHIHDLYRILSENPETDIVPRTFIFAGKAAPSYYYAKGIIKYINTLADMINSDKNVSKKIKVIFLENYCVSLAELIFPASDVSEQISTASKEASGTGNMKFMMNGAVTIGTMDGANIEIKEMAGDDNFITFGLSVEEVLGYYQKGGYNSWEIYGKDPRIKYIMDSLISGTMHRTPRDEFMNIYRSLLEYNDEFFVFKDFDSYANAHKKLEELYRDKNIWQRMSAMNIAMSGTFSSDNTINKYASEIWKIQKSEPDDIVY